MSDFIPFAIQEDILKRLPTRSLMQFRSVSKEWKSLIDSSEFVVDYSLNHTHQQHLLVSSLDQEDLDQYYVSIVDDETFPEQKCSLPVPIPQLGNPIILGSSHGLFFIYCCHVAPRDFPRYTYFAVLWNPPIRKSVAIDVPFDLKRPSNFVIGFGVRPHTSDPMLVKISYRPDNITFTPWQVEVYTLSSGAWRSIPTINQPHNTIRLRAHQITVDEFMYWLAVDCRNGTGFQGYNWIVSFNMTSEEFMEVSLPDAVARAPTGNVVISKLKESLVVVETVIEAEKKFYCIWMMDHGVPNSFTKLFTINSPDASIRAILGFRKNNEPIFAMRLRTDYSLHDIFVHKLHSEGIDYTRISGNDSIHFACSYMETLLLLDH